MLELLVELRRIFQFVVFAVDFHAGKAALQEVCELFPVFAFAAADHGCEEVELGAVAKRHRLVDHLGDGLAFDREAGGGRVGDADPRPEQAHVVVDLGDGSDGGARVARGGLLLDRDGGREAFDALDIRLLHQFEELAGVGG